MSVLEKIQNLCKENDITISQLEKELQFGRGTLYKWANSSPTSDKLLKVAQYFSISVDYLLENDTSNLMNQNMNNGFFKIVKEARQNGFSPEDLDLAMNFLKQARERDDSYKNNK